MHELSLRLAPLLGLCFGLCLTLGCGQVADPTPAVGATASPSAPTASTAPAGKPGSPQPGASSSPAAARANKSLIGEEGIAAWDALAAGEKEKIRNFGTLFLHQSVGQDLEDGAEAAGYKFNYYGPDHKASPGLNGGIFVDVKPGLGNGNPVEKLGVFRDAVLRNKSLLRVAVMKLGYADVRQSDLASVQAQYLRTVTELRGAGVRVLHVTPPLVFDPAENAPKISMRNWMISTFSSDVVFDLQDIESKSGGVRCEVAGTWRICPQNRSTASCPSKGQGVDGDGAGHLCEKAAGRIAKAFLYAIYRAGN